MKEGALKSVHKKIYDIDLTAKWWMQSMRTEGASKSMWLIAQPMSRNVMIPFCAVNVKKGSLLHF